MRSFIILLTGMALLGSNVTCAQSNPKNASLGKAIKDLGSFFKKKPASLPAGNDKLPANNAAVQADKGNAGALSPGAVSLAVDKLFDFNKGVAIVRKGTSAALIDPKGNLVVPFNSYDFSYYTVSVLQNVLLSNGLLRFQTTDHQQWGYMNSSATVIARGVLNDLTDNKRLLELNNSGRWTYTTPDGKKYFPGDRLADINEGIGIMRRQINGNVIIGYKRLSGDPLVTTAFDELYRFSEGLAVVGKKDQFGDIKYGYINTDGKLVIPLLYSIKPSEFSGGYARVVPKDKSAFEYAFINKKGEIVFRQTQADILKYGTFDHFTTYGMAFNMKYVMDATFKLTSKADFFKSYGIPADSWFIGEQNSVEGETNPKLLYSTRGVVGTYTRLPLTGFINFGTGKVVAPVFDLLNVNAIYFDPTAKLAYAKVCLGKSNTGALIYREGYINENGLFVIVKAEGSRW
ncbi:WG repeat-containing protein [Mucilaginibacter sp. SMC90]|uniref:WG repeat-containing protein n=1 Tax=Mucilaginibacter sp. SMC90 TaxID=2929803 RepID=UPI001FB1C991|nr:WG repeat-containing protein [Mucilaginibacter sp. SMC90]UOE47908.1 WG repeat-containing protein [Mucilaginibacter sp. SMC90]